MDKGLIHAYYGSKGDQTSLAIGEAISCASKGQSVIMIQFLKGKDEEQIRFIQQLEPDVKLFRFEKSNSSFEELSSEKKQEEEQNIKNGLNFAKKVLSTKECSLLILDGILDLLEHHIILSADVIAIVDSKGEDVEIIMTGSNIQEELIPYVEDAVQMQSIDYRFL